MFNENIICFIKSNGEGKFTYLLIKTYKSDSLKVKELHIKIGSGKIENYKRVITRLL